MRSLLIVTEVALALMLLIGAGLLVQSFLRLQRASPGFNPQQVSAFNLSLPAARYNEPQQAAFYRHLLSRVETLPGVAAAGVVNPLPLSGSQMDVNFEIEGRPTPRADRPPASYRAASPNYFRAMSVPLLKGRDFTRTTA